MLSADTTDFNRLAADFTWRIPPRYNMAVDTCDRWAAAQPSRVAIIDMTGAGRVDVSYGALQAQANRLANRLGQFGVGPGARVGVLRSQSVWTAAAHLAVWTAAAHLAVWKLGAISMPLFTLFGTDALLSRLGDSAAVAVITDAPGRERLAGLRDRLPALKHIIVPETDGIEAESTDFSTADTAADDPALLIYTSGTTGTPKGALHAHRVLLGHLPGVEISHDLLPQPGDLLWTPADWAWIGGLLDVLMPGLCLGVPVVAARFDKFTAEATAALVRQVGIRNVFFPPTALKLLRASGVTIPGLRSVASGGEPLGAEMLAWGRAALGVTINEFYGQTECNMVASSCARLFEVRPGCIGRPVPGHGLAVINEMGQPLTDAEGDIAIRRGSPVMMLEYWRNPSATAAKFRGDWLLTGDRGVLSADGYLRFVGRDDDVITSAGYRIGPAEIEDCLIRHPAVAAVGVVGKPDPTRTEIVKAYVVLREGQVGDEALRAALQQHVKVHLAAYEYPREIDFVEALPMTVTGKIVRRELRERARREAADQSG